MSNAPADSSESVSSTLARPRPKSVLLPLAIVGVALFIAIFDNTALFRSVLQLTELDEHRLAIVLTMAVLVVGTLVVILAMAAGARLFKLVAATLLIVAAGCAYFMNNYGIVIDTSMIRNAAETNIREASPLITSGFLLHVATFGLAPALVIFWLPLRHIGWKKEVLLRASVILASSLLFGGTMYVNYASAAYFGGENHQLRMQINPIYPLYSSFRYLTRADDKPPPVRTPLTAAVSTSHSARKRPTLFIFVMGETARADRQSLNGYTRDTNRYTSSHGIVNFGEVTSCGTSTADSVPCIFSRFSRADFTHARFAREESLLQTLERLGIKTFWRDNSTGCKHICDPARFEQLAGADDPELCDDTGCFDELMLERLEALIGDNSSDHFIVLHQRGSHGPAYFTDTPEWSKAFLPECNQKNVRNCSLDAVNNAYDNTILYSDYFLASIIERLEAESDRYSTAMLYVSDHGESLGEKGLFLHGLPYSFAPEEQTHVPMILWGSDDFYASHALDQQCVRDVATEPTSHDAIFHTILALFDIETPVYEEALDIFSSCRDEPGVPLEKSAF